MARVFLFGGIYFEGPNSSNRGCQALSYSSIDFIRLKLDREVSEIIVPRYYYRRKGRKNITVKDTTVKTTIKFFWLFDIFLSIIVYRMFPKSRVLKLLPFAKELSRTKYICNISGGDSFSDIYGFRQFFLLAIPSIISVFLKIKLVLLPQTIGVFKKQSNRRIANYILKSAFKIYVRDDEFVPELKRMKLNYVKETDVSFYLKPQPVKGVEIANDSVGINISGLAYYNSFKDLTGKFDNYKELIIEIIENFQSLNKKIYLIPHTYNFGSPETNSDDLSASIEILQFLKKQNDVEVINYDLTAVQLKYLISCFDFLIGSRMHACFAAIFTGTPAFGLAYSYKFSGSFEKYGLKSCYASVLNLDKKHIPQIIKKINGVYNSRADYRLKLKAQGFG